MERKYLEPLRTCAKTLKETEGVNYIILVADAAEEDREKFIGGSGWNIEETESPDFFTMVGGLIEHYLRENNIRYIDKVKLINAFSKELIENITNLAENDIKEGE